MALEAEAPYELPDVDWAKGYPEGSAEADAEFNRLLAVSNALPVGEVVGGMLRWQRGDGYAWYLVVSDEPLIVQHVPYMDAWTIERPLIKGLDRDDVLEMLDRHRRMAEIFGWRK